MIWGYPYFWKHPISFVFLVEKWLVMVIEVLTFFLFLAAFVFVLCFLAQQKKSGRDFFENWGMPRELVHWEMFALLGVMILWSVKQSPTRRCLLLDFKYRILLIEKFVHDAVPLGFASAGWLPVFCGVTFVIAVPLCGVTSGSVGWERAIARTTPKKEKKLFRGLWS